MSGPDRLSCRDRAALFSHHLDGWCDPSVCKSLQEESLRCTILKYQTGGLHQAMQGDAGGEGLSKVTTTDSLGLVDNTN